MSRYQKAPNPDNKPCEFTGVAAAATWYFWVERSSTSDGKLARQWYAGGEVGSSFRRKVAELKARASQDGFEIIAWTRGAPLPVAATVVHTSSAASSSTAAVSGPVAGATERAVSEAPPRAVPAQKTEQLTLFGNRSAEPSALSTASAAANEPSSTGASGIERADRRHSTTAGTLAVSFRVLNVSFAS